EDPLVLNEYREDLRTECEKFGEVKKVILFDRHPDGVASVAFKEPEQADACILSFNGRWFGGRQLSAQLWDGTTDHQVEETSREREERLKGWSAFLDGTDKEQQKNCGSEPAESSTEPSESTSTTEPQKTEPQLSEQPEEQVDSTDSSLAGSDNDEA
ncbi:HIV Tat-specific factor 1, partial [Characodon lateralis]|nr:HIV Tat-specific factor 1 [Characodon lateralis]